MVMDQLITHTTRSCPNNIPIPINISTKLFIDFNMAILSFICVLFKVFVTLKRHLEQGKSSKRNIYWSSSILFRGSVHYWQVGETGGSHGDAQEDMELATPLPEGNRKDSQTLGSIFVIYFGSLLPAYLPYNTCSGETFPLMDTTLLLEKSFP